MTLEDELRPWVTSEEGLRLILKAVDAGKDATALVEKYAPGFIEDQYLKDYLWEEEEYNEVYGSDYGIDLYTDGIF